MNNSLIVGHVINTISHWGRATHICVDKLTIIGSDNGLSSGRHQAIIWANVGILLIGPLRTNFSEILIGIQTFSFKKMHLKMSSAKWRPFVSASMWYPCAGKVMCWQPHFTRFYIPSNMRRSCREDKIDWHWSKACHMCIIRGTYYRLPVSIICVSMCHSLNGFIYQLLQCHHYVLVQEYSGFLTLIPVWGLLYRWVSARKT